MSGDGFTMTDYREAVEAARNAARSAGVDAFNNALVSAGYVTGVDAFGVAIDTYEAALKAAGYVMVPRESPEALAHAIYDAMREEDPQSWWAPLELEGRKTGIDGHFDLVAVARRLLEGDHGSGS
jgi:hypothetical protein